MNEDSGQPWSPPQELMLPTPNWLAAAGQSGWKASLMASYVLLALILAASVLSLVFLDDKTLGFGGSIVVVGILILSSAFLAANCRKAKRLLMWGKPARAVVIDAELQWLRNGCLWIWTIEYQDETGNLVQSEIKEHKMSTRAREPAKYVRNQVLTVLYDPHKPMRVAAYPVAGYEIVEPGSS